MILGTIRAPALWLSHLPRISWFGSMQHIVLYCLGLISHWLYSLLIWKSFCWGPKIFSVTQSIAVAIWFWSDKSAPQWGALIYIWAFVYGWASTLIEIFTVICYAVRSAKDFSKSQRIQPMRPKWSDTIHQLLGAKKMIWGNLFFIGPIRSLI